MTDPRLAGALLKMTSQWMEHLDSKSRKWFIQSLKQMVPKQDFTYPNGKTDDGKKLPQNPFDLLI